MPAVEVIYDGKTVSAEYIRRLIQKSEGKGDQGAWDVVNGLASLTSVLRPFRVTVERQYLVNATSPQDAEDRVWTATARDHRPGVKLVNSYITENEAGS